MAGRPRLEPGELGSVAFENTPHGVRGRARVRDGSGTLRRISASGTTADTVTADLKQQAAALVHRTTGDEADSTIGEMLDAWVQRSRRKCRPQTARTYQSTAEWLKKYCGAIPISSFGLRQARTLLRTIEDEHSATTARRAKVALTGAFAQAIDRDIVDRNPIRDIDEEEPEPQTPTFLTLTQVRILRNAIRAREERTRTHVGDSAGLLRWGVEICLGTGLRIGEVLALRHIDVDFDMGRVSVQATLIDGTDWKTQRQPKLKSLHQARVVQVPPFALAAFAEARDAAKDSDPYAPALQSRNGSWVNTRNFRRQLREVRVDPTVARSLALTELTPEHLTPHILRRTASTLLAQMKGELEGASALLGHSDVSTTKRHYVGIAWRVVDEADALQELFGPGAAAE
ncbi:tyrosine-type recombinase/integrase [uncultured Microbacterium sp.]|uniref:tyrosine-type recombinase/integrase n=1 Tax=uncultured Microbacterium sp. TaxID=191216 RepID=UPI0025F57C93|nr:tyrosine-type recombinase/integrase [uncultured Microbacterium sp.]